MEADLKNIDEIKSIINDLDLSENRFNWNSEKFTENVERLGQCKNLSKLSLSKNPFIQNDGMDQWYRLVVQKCAKLAWLDGQHIPDRKKFESETIGMDLNTQQSKKKSQKELDERERKKNQSDQKAMDDFDKKKDLQVMKDKWKVLEEDKDVSGLDFCIMLVNSDMQDQSECLYKINTVATKI